MLERHSSIDEINAADVKQIYPSGDSRLRDRSDNFEAFWRIERASPTRCFHDQCLASYRMTMSVARIASCWAQVRLNHLLLNTSMANS